MTPSNISTETESAEPATECATARCPGCVWCGKPPPPITESMTAADLTWALGMNLGYALGALIAVEGPGSCCAKNLGALLVHFVHFLALADLAKLKPDLYRQCLEYRRAHTEERNPAVEQFIRERSEGGSYAPDDRPGETFIFRNVRVPFGDIVEKLAERGYRVVSP